jgi:predicted transcriptional regulator
MDADEREIINYLKTWGSTYVNAKEIARRACTKKRFHEEPDWAKPVLLRLVEKGFLESDISGRYRLKPESKHDKTKRWVAPDIKEILEEGGVHVEGSESIRIDEEDF